MGKLFSSKNIVLSLKTVQKLNPELSWVLVVSALRVFVTASSKQPTRYVKPVATTYRLRKTFRKQPTGHGRSIASILQVAEYLQCVYVVVCWTARMPDVINFTTFYVGFTSAFCATGDCNYIDIRKVLGDQSNLAMIFSSGIPRRRCCLTPPAPSYLSVGTLHFPATRSFKLKGSIRISFKDSVYLLREHFLEDMHLTRCPLERQSLDATVGKIP